MKLLHLSTREKWRAWLAANHRKESEIWLVYHKKHTGRSRIPYEHAVEEALCFGWIDSIVRRLDDDRFAQKFTPRRAGSNWSRLNRQRFDRLLSAGRVEEAGLARRPLPAASDEPAIARDAGSRQTLPAYIRAGLRENPAVWINFQKLAPSQRRLYVRWIDSAKKLETRRRRLVEAIDRLAKNQKLGMK